MAGIASIVHRIVFGSILLASIAGCNNAQSGSTEKLSDAEVKALLAAPHPPKMLGAGVSGFNYSPNFIGYFRIEGPFGIGGGGPNIMPAPPGGRSGGGAESCCGKIPEAWQPGLKVTVYWHVEKVADGKTPGVVYRATTEIPQYDGQTSGALWAIFLPDDRVKVMVADGNTNKHNSVDVRPAEDDPLVAQGVIDDDETREVRARGRNAYCANDESKCPPRYRDVFYGPGGPCKPGLPCLLTPDEEKN